MTAKLHTPNSTELVRFLLARLDDDDQELRTLHRKQSRGATVTLTHNVPIDRMLADCRAKRDVIGYAQQLFLLRDQPQEKAVRDNALKMLCALALPYRDHPGFKDEWTP